MIIEEFELSTAVQRAFRASQMFQQIIKNNQAEFFCQAFQTPDEAPESVVSLGNWSIFHENFTRNYFRLCPAW